MLFLVNSRYVWYIGNCRGSKADSGSIQAKDQQFEKGFKKNVNRKLREIIYEVIEDAEKLTPEEQTLTRYFMANLSDAFCWGGYHSPRGVLLAIPHNFAYEEPSDINLKNASFGGRTADPVNDQKRFLTPELLESEDAKVHYG